MSGNFPYLKIEGREFRQKMKKELGEHDCIKDTVREASYFRKNTCENEEF